jgi:hypothetical protein
MSAFFRNMTLVSCLWLSMTGICLGKQVYLRDGGIIDCKSFWRHGTVVTVLINRDTMVEFDRKEIDMKRTFPASGKKSHPVRRHKTGSAARSQEND